MSAMIAQDARLAAGGGPASSSSTAVGQAGLPQVLIGDAEYYGRWGFSAAMTGGWRCPGPFEQHRLLARGHGLAAMPVDGMLGPWGAIEA